MDLIKTFIDVTRQENIEKTMATLLSRDGDTYNSNSCKFMAKVSHALWLVIIKDTTLNFQIEKFVDYLMLKPPYHWHDQMYMFTFFKLSKCTSVNLFKYNTSNNFALQYIVAREVKEGKVIADNRDYKFVCVSKDREDMHPYLRKILITLCRLDFGLISIEETKEILKEIPENLDKE